MKRLMAAALLVSACATAPGPLHIDGEQGRLFVSDGGSGPGTPLVFVHGNGGNLTQWSAQLAHFRRSRRAIAYDLRGMGRSDVPVNGEYTIDGMVDDLHRLVNALNVDTFVLVGHSYGGAVVAAYAAHHPERVAGVVFADAAGDIKATRAQSESYLEALRMDKHGTVRKAYEPMMATASEEMKAAILMSADRTSTEAYVEAMEGIRDFSVARAVAAIRAPMLAVAAIDHENSFHVQFPRVPARRMSGAGHWLMMERPAEFNAILDDWLKTVDAMQAARHGH